MIEKSLTVVLGSPKHKICSIGSFARAEAKAFEESGWKVNIVEPDEKWNFPIEKAAKTAFVMIHIPSLYDRRSPVNVLYSAGMTKKHFRNSHIYMNIHEYHDAPKHFRLRARLAAKFTDTIVVNTRVDESHMASWGKSILRTPLGPTLWNENLLKNPHVDNLIAEKSKANSKLSLEIKNIFDQRSPVLLHPGLLFPGKGLEFLLDWARKTKDHLSYKLVLSGGIGPKKRDHEYAEKIVIEFQKTLKDRFLFVKEPSDEVYQNLLIASDLVVLPFTAGLSEKRSTFLSAASCGSSLWTTESALTKDLNLPKEGPFLAPVESAQIMEESLSNCVKNYSEKEHFLHRAENIKWASLRSWTHRIQAFETHMNTLKDKK